MPAYEVKTYPGKGQSEHIFITENPEVVKNYIKSVLSKYYDKVVIENGETTVSYGWSVYDNQDVIKNKDAFLDAGVEYFFSNGFLCLRLTPYSSIKRMYTTLKNKATKYILSGSSYYNYSFGRIKTLKEIPTLETFYKHYKEHYSSSTNIYIYFKKVPSNGNEAEDLIEATLNSKQYIVPEWFKQLRTKMKIEELMHKAFVRRKECLNIDKDNPDT